METNHSVAEDIKTLLEGEDLLLLGLTGGIGTGKTVVANMFGDMGATLIDFDDLAREVVMPGKPAWKEIVHVFGEGILFEDRSLDRKKLRGIVFQDTSKRLLLEESTHPRIYRLFVSRLKEIVTRDPHAIVLSIIPLLFECRLQPWFHKTLLVFAPRKMQIQRLMAREGLRADQAENILQAQMPIQEKKPLAHMVIDNSGPMEKTREAVAALWPILEEMQRERLKKIDRRYGCMTMNNQRLKEVGHIEVTTIIDNYVDVLLESSGIVTRPSTDKDGVILTDTLLAEHGLSLLLKVSQDEDRASLLFDTGHSQLGLLHNFELLGLDPNDIDAIVLSHFHMDHTGSLYPLLENLSRPIPVIVHPDAFEFPRTLHLKDGSIRQFPVTLSREVLESRGVPIMESVGPLLFGDGMILITGEVERTTSFEKGLPNAYMEKGGHTVKDPVLCDQALVMNLKGQGLVVISGCSHAGIANTIQYAMKITGVHRLHALLGGFHLGGPPFEPIIEDTIEAVKALDPQVVVPMHCTGQKAIQRFKEAFPDAFVLNSVGSIVTLQS